MCEKIGNRCNVIGNCFSYRMKLYIIGMLLMEDSYNKLSKKFNCTQLIDMLPNHGSM